MNVWVLATSTVAPLAKQLEKQLAARGFDSTVTVTGYGELDAQALDEKSAYRVAAPDTAVLIADTHDLLRPVFESPMSRGALARQHDLDHALSRIGAALRSAAATSDHVFVTNGTYPPSNSLGLLEGDGGMSLGGMVGRYNVALAELATEHNNVHVVDYRGLVASIGYDAFHDRRMWAHARMRLSDTGVTSLANLLARALVASRRRPRKCVVVDLDNTLWGGVLGEVGRSGVQVGGEGVGVCYAELQRELLELRARGVLLAIASKNDHDDAMKTIETHLGMVVRPEHFAATRIGWNDKAESLGQIADELNLSVGALVLVDDSAHECAAIRAVLPQVSVVELPKDPADYVDALRACEALDTLMLTDTDRRRSELIGQERARAESAAAAPDMQTFLRELHQHATLTRLSQANTPRAAQLCARTNQFNVTLRRHDQLALCKLVADGAVGLVVSARDRLGDAGVIGFGLVKPDPARPDHWELDTMVMSCRVLGRGLETVLLSELVAAARKAGAAHIVARYAPGPRNSMCATFLVDHGFGADDEGVHQLACGSNGSPITPPDHIHVGWEPE